MALFDYKALDSNGRNVSGTIEAENRADARDRLRERSLLLVELEPSKGLKRHQLSAEQLVTFTTLLSQLVGAGVPLFESLQAIEQQYSGEKGHLLLQNLCERIRRGGDLSQALAEHPETFSSMYCSMVAAGESSGALDIVLERLTDSLKRQQRLRQQLITAMVYPSLLALFALVVIAMLLGFVVPSMESIFEGRELNTFTQIVLSTSHHLRSWWWIYVLASFLALFLGYRSLQRPAGKRWLQSMVLRIPILNQVVAKAAFARFSRTMATMQQGGVPLIDSLAVAQGVMENHLLEEQMEEAKQKVVTGCSLGDEMAHMAWVPPMMTRMISVGEETGRLGTMFEKVADFYEEDLEKATARMLALAQPIILIVMGLVIGAILLAILLPMADAAAFTGV